jgi:hypothetical protein
MNNSGIEIYKSEDGKTQVQVVLENETVWLNLNQITELFQRDKSFISRHLRNIFKEGELAKNSVVANFATTAKDGKSYQVEYFNLDVIISVGYRVKSKRGTQFRIWASKILKDYLIQGYSLNEKKLLQQNEQLKDLRESVKILGNVLKFKALSNDESAGHLKIISDYALVA